MRVGGWVRVGVGCGGGGRWVEVGASLLCFFLTLSSHPEFVFHPYQSSISPAKRPGSQWEPSQVPFLEQSKNRITASEKS